MRVLMLNGSPRQFGCTYTALQSVADALRSEDIMTEIIWAGDKPIQDCVRCDACTKLGKCIYENDVVNELIEKSKLADGFVFGAPVYYAHPGGRILSILDRVFYAASKYLSYKPGAAVVAARRSGTTAALDVLNKYFTINKMPIVSSQYWNIVYGRTPEEAQKDVEGVQTLKILGKNMAWLMKGMNLAQKNGIVKPEEVARQSTNFIR
ncbi:MAG: flavodoxin family protein [Alphaproteobacteria bacterium]|nr:flavodoxin family protein [Alphaproteobacteria bacterium]